MGGARTLGGSEGSVVSGTSHHTSALAPFLKQQTSWAVYYSKFSAEPQSYRPRHRPHTHDIQEYYVRETHPNLRQKNGSSDLV